MLLMRATIDERSNPHRARHVHAGHELLAVAEGGGNQLSVRGEEPCRTGDVFVFPAGQPHMSHADRGQAFACWVVQHEPGDFADGAPGDGGERLLQGVAATAVADNRLRLRPTTRARVSALLARAVGEWLHGAAGARCAARALVMEALVAIVRDPGAAVAERDPVAPGDRHVDAALRWLEQYWMQPVRIADLVALGPLGRSQLLARFRARAGRSVSDALLDIRVREAQRMLNAGGGSMLDIALACGFGSQSHFNHRFKRATGLGPRAWLRAQG